MDVKYHSLTQLILELRLSLHLTQTIRHGMLIIKDSSFVMEIIFLLVLQRLICSLIQQSQLLIQLLLIGEMELMKLSLSPITC